MLRTIAAASLFATAATSAQAHEARLPLGDGKIVAQPRTGYVLACQRFFPGGRGAHRTGEWISDGYWTPDAKPRVEGEVDWPGASISVRREGDLRVVRANALPTHATGEYPIRPGTEAYRYDRNPNHIGEHAILLTLPAEPKPATQPSCVPMGMIGFALSGVAIFNAFDAGGRDAPAYEIQDRCNGHPQMTSLYHYHDWSPCLKGSDPNAPLGWILDGFPILGPADGKGHRYTNADLNECHGMVGPVTIDGKRVVTYHYRFTDEFPYTIGCFRGTPVRTVRQGPPRGMPPPMG